jgi:hypothetical protein
MTTLPAVPQFKSDVPALDTKPRKPAVPTYFDQNGQTFGHDAILQTDERARFRAAPDALWRDVLAQWQTGIQNESLVDVSVSHFRTPTTLSPLGMQLRPGDGALIRTVGGQALAFQPSAWGQLCSLLMVEQGVPRFAESLAWLSPPVRAIAFGDMRDRSRRIEGVNRPLVLRSHVDGRTGLRALRAVLSGTHSGVHFDDLALAHALGSILRPDAPAYVSRGVTETYGFAVLNTAGNGAPGEVSPTLTWGNSETGAGSLRFGGGLFIRAVGQSLRFAGVERAVTVASASANTRRRHTLPRVNVSESYRAEEAQRRMRADIGNATRGAIELATKWGDALRSFPEGFDVAVRPTDLQVAAAVAMDAITERSSDLDAETIGNLERVLSAENGLKGLPWLSAAYVAAAFALVASEATTVAKGVALQEIAGSWVTGW